MVLSACAGGASARLAVSLLRCMRVEVAYRVPPLVERHGGGWTQLSARAGACGMDEILAKLLNVCYLTFRGKR
jgi:hypothetical protein